jgi:hypothetical protein
MPLAREKRRGCALNWRFAVKGIQKASSSGRLRGALAFDMGSLVGGSRVMKGRE